MQWVTLERTQVAQGDSQEDQVRVGLHPKGPMAHWVEPRKTKGLLGGTKEDQDRVGQYQEGPNQGRVGPRTSGYLLSPIAVRGSGPYFFVVCRLLDTLAIK